MKAKDLFNFKIDDIEGMRDNQNNANKYILEHNPHTFIYFKYNYYGCVANAGYSFDCNIDRLIEKSFIFGDDTSILSFRARFNYGLKCDDATFMKRYLKGCESDTICYFYASIFNKCNVTHDIGYYVLLVESAKDGFIYTVAYDYYTQLCVFISPDSYKFVCLPLLGCLKLLRAVHEDEILSQVSRVILEELKHEHRYVRLGCEFANNVLERCHNQPTFKTSQTVHMDMNRRDRKYLGKDVQSYSVEDLETLLKAGIKFDDDSTK